MSSCPGRDSRKISAELIACRSCGAKIELFSDEMRRNCPRCAARVTRQKPPSCADWCASAKDCQAGLVKPIR